MQCLSLFYASTVHRYRSSFKPFVEDPYAAGGANSCAFWDSGQRHNIHTRETSLFQNAVNSVARLLKKRFAWKQFLLSFCHFRLVFFLQKSQELVSWATKAQKTAFPPLVVSSKFKRGVVGATRPVCMKEPKVKALVLFGAFFGNELWGVEFCGTMVLVRSPKLCFIRITLQDILISNTSACLVRKTLQNCVLFATSVFWVSYERCGQQIKMLTKKNLLFINTKKQTVMGRNSYL